MTRKAFIGMIRAAALAAILFLASGAIPLVGPIAMLFAPAPLLLYAVGRPNARARVLMAAALTTLMVSIGAGLMAGASYLVSFGVAAVLIAEMLERRKPFEIVIGVTAAAMLVASGLVALLAAGSVPALVETMHRELAEGMARGQEFYRTFGIAGVVSEDARRRIIDLTIELSPALVAILAAVTVLMNLRLFWRWVGRQRLEYDPFGDLSKWSSPPWMVWALLAAGFAMFIPLRPVPGIALDSFVCVAAVYLFQGFAIAAFYFHVLAVPGIVRAIIYVVALAQPILAALICIAGIFDMWVDFRRLRSQSGEAGGLDDPL